MPALGLGPKRTMGVWMKRCVHVTRISLARAANGFQEVSACAAVSSGCG